MPIVYLSGPISGLTYGECTTWREYAARELARCGISTADPMRGKAHLAGLYTDRAIPHGGQGVYDQHQGCSSASITQRDRFDTMRADALLVNLCGATAVSIGTMIELGWADAARVPIVLARDNDVHKHLLVDGVAGWVTPSLDAALAVVRELLAPYRDGAPSS